VDVPWTDGGLTLHVRRGTIIECPSGSAMETAYGGPGNLENITGLGDDGTTLDGRAQTN
jgi:hypothetical protein